MLQEALKINVEDEPAPEGKLWVVQVGAYKSRNNAEALRKRLEGMGVVSMIKIYNEE